MTTSELDDLVQRFINGQSELFDVIYYETYQSVFLSIRTIIKDKMTVEDLMQDTYMTALDKLTQYQKGTNFKAWICRIGRNLAINHYNKYKRVEVCDPTDIVFSSEDKPSKLNYYLSYLEGLEREVVIYHIIMGMKFKEIAKIIDMPLSSTFLIYKKAIEKVKKGA